MTADAELETFKDLLTDSDVDVDALIDAGRDVCYAVERLQKDYDSLENEHEELKEKIKNQDKGERLIQVLQTRYPRLFSGDLSKLDHGERADLFEAIAEFESSSIQDSDCERTVARIDGKLR